MLQETLSIAAPEFWSLRSPADSSNLEDDDFGYIIITLRLDCSVSFVQFLGGQGRLEEMGLTHLGEWREINLRKPTLLLLART